MEEVTQRAEVFLLQEVHLPLKEALPPAGDLQHRALHLITRIHQRLQDHPRQSDLIPTAHRLDLPSHLLESITDPILHILTITFHRPEDPHLDHSKVLVQTNLSHLTRLEDHSLQEGLGIPILDHLRFLDNPFLNTYHQVAVTYPFDTQLVGNIDANISSKL